MHTPLGVSVPIQSVGQQRSQPEVPSVERLWDALAMLIILAGTTLFLLARRGLEAMTDRNYTLPRGFATYVQRADYLSAQSSLGLGMIAVGVGVGVMAAIRHALRRRRAQGQSTRPAA